MTPGPHGAPGSMTSGSASASGSCRGSGHDRRRRRSGQWCLFLLDYISTIDTKTRFSLEVFFMDPSKLAFLKVLLRVLFVPFLLILLKMRRRFSSEVFFMNPCKDCPGYESDFCAHCAYTLGIEIKDEREDEHTVPLWSDSESRFVSCNGFKYPTLSRYPYRSDGRVESICDFCSNDISCGECVYGEP